MRNTVGFIRAGSEVQFTVFRDGKILVLKTTTATRKAFKQKQEASNPYFDGVTLSNVDLQNTAHGHVTGIRVQGASVDSLAWAGGLRPGDIIVLVNQKEVKTISDLNVVTANSKEALVLNVLRGNNAIFLVIK